MMLNVGIVGSRRRNNMPDRKMVYALVEQLKQENPGRLVLVSGGCPKGADSFTEEAGRLFGVPVVVYKPDLSKPSRYTAEPFFARNQQVAADSHELYCLVSPDRTGGTENTIRHMLEFKKSVYLVDAIGDCYLSKDGEYPSCEPSRRLLGFNRTGSSSGIWAPAAI